MVPITDGMHDLPNSFIFNKSNSCINLLLMRLPTYSPLETAIITSALMLHYSTLPLAV
jgi:hypothetical protein